MRTISAERIGSTFGTQFGRADQPWAAAHGYHSRTPSGFAPPPNVSPLAPNDLAPRPKVSVADMGCTFGTFRTIVRIRGCRFARPPVTQMQPLRGLSASSQRFRPSPPKMSVADMGCTFGTNKATALIRGCRYARPPATMCNPFGVKPPAADGCASFPRRLCPSLPRLSPSPLRFFTVNKRSSACISRRNSLSLRKVSGLP